MTAPVHYGKARGISWEQPLLPTLFLFTVVEIENRDQARMGHKADLSEVWYTLL